MTVNLQGQSVDSTMVVSYLLNQRSPGMTESKGLINHTFGEGWATFSGLAGPPKRGYSDLLVQQGLLAKGLRRGGERLLNLEDLLTVVPTSLKGLFENRSILRPLSLCRIAPNSVISCQNAPKSGIESTVCRGRFCENGVGACSMGAIPTSAEHKLAGHAETVRARHSYLPTGSHRSQEQIAGWLPIWSN